MTAIEKWRRLTNPQSVEDYGLSVNLADLAQSDEGREILRREILPWLPVTERTPATPAPR